MAEIPERKKLIEYLPEFMRHFKELQQVTSVEEKRMEDIDGKIANLIDEAFIEDCDETGIAKYEGFLGITPEPADTLPERKKRVLIYWNNYLPYTIRTLARKVRAYCGDKFELGGSLKDYELEIHTSLESPSTVREVESETDLMIPENMHVSIFNNVDRAASGKMHVGCAVAKNITRTIYTKTE